MNENSEDRAKETGKLSLELSKELFAQLEKQARENFSSVEQEITRILKARIEHEH